MGWHFNGTGVGIMVTALAFLVVGGITFNNLQASGFVSETPATTCISIQCPAFGQTNPTPIILCATHTQCQITKPSFLNQNSPWTFLLGGDFAGFLQSFTNSPSSAGLNGMSACSTVQGSIQHATLFHCSANAWDYVGPPYQQYPLVSCNLRNPSKPINIGFNVTANTAPVTLSGAHNVTVFTVIGCIPATQANVQPTNNSAALQLLASISGSNGSIVLTRYQPGLVDLLGSGGNALNLVTFLGFIIAIILFVMSFGVGFSAGASALGSGGTGGFSSNAQGTRFAQVLAFGLVLWLPLYSEFGTWISSLGGYSVDALVTAALLIVFFIGVWTQTSSGTSAS